MSGGAASVLLARGTGRTVSGRDRLRRNVSPDRNGEVYISRAGSSRYSAPPVPRGLSLTRASPPSTLVISPPSPPVAGELFRPGRGQTANDLTAAGRQQRAASAPGGHVGFGGRRRRAHPCVDREHIADMAAAARASRDEVRPRGDARGRRAAGVACAADRSSARRRASDAASACCATVRDRLRTARLGRGHGALDDGRLSGCRRRDACAVRPAGPFRVDAAPSVAAARIGVVFLSAGAESVRAWRAGLCRRTRFDTWSARGAGPLARG